MRANYALVAKQSLFSATQQDLLPWLSLNSAVDLVQYKYDLYIPIPCFWQSGNIRFSYVVCVCLVTVVAAAAAV